MNSVFLARPRQMRAIAFPATDGPTLLCRSVPQQISMYVQVSMLRVSRLLSFGPELGPVVLGPRSMS